MMCYYLNVQFQGQRVKPDLQLLQTCSMHTCHTQFQNDLSSGSNPATYIQTGRQRK